MRTGAGPFVPPMAAHASSSFAAPFIVSQAASSDEAGFGLEGFAFTGGPPRLVSTVATLGAGRPSARKPPDCWRSLASAGLITSTGAASARSGGAVASIGGAGIPAASAMCGYCEGGRVGSASLSLGSSFSGTGDPSSEPP